MKTRITGPHESCYHVFSRIIEKRFYLGDSEKDVFRDMMWRVAEFSGIQILTYCVMDNHFHILVQVPEPKDITDDELYRRLCVLYGRSRNSSWNDPINEFERSKEDAVWRDRLRKKYLRRMYDLSEFMRTLKLRYSFWFNKNHNREGTLWDARFRSILVEGSSGGAGNLSTVTVAAYIDLNPVRAGIVNDPSRFRWCGYAEAAAGMKRIRYGFSYLYGCHLKNTPGWKEILTAYQTVLREKGGIYRDDAIGDCLLSKRIRYFTAGAVLGSRSYVNNMFMLNRSFFGPKRTEGACRMRHGDWKGLCAARQVG